MSARLLSRERVDVPNVYRWSWGETERVRVLVVAEWEGEGWRAFVEWPDSVRTVPGLGEVQRPAGWVRAAALLVCCACEGSREVPSASGLSDVRCEVCA